jgi:hypothetical protein
MPSGASGSRTVVLVTPKLWEASVEELRSQTPFDDETLDRLAVCFHRVRLALADHGVEADDGVMDDVALALMSKAGDGEDDQVKLVNYASMKVWGRHCREFEAAKIATQRRQNESS